MINLITIKIDCEMDETTLSDAILENKKYYDIKTVGFKDYVLLTGTKDNYITDNPSEIEKFINESQIKIYG